MKSLHKFVITLLFAVLLCLTTGLCACAGSEKNEYFTVMLPEGEGYSVVQNSVRSVQRGESVEFEIVLHDGYEFVHTDYGRFEGGKLTIEDIKFSVTIDFKVRLFENIASVKNGTVRIESKSGEPARYGEEADFYIIPNENYIVNTVFVNGASYEFAREANGVVVISEIYDEFISVRADCIGRECSVAIDVPQLPEDEAGGIITVFGADDGIARYGDELEITCTATDGYRFVYMTVNNNRYHDGNKLTLTVESDMNISALFVDESYYAVVYDYNGGECLDDSPYDFSRHGQNIYLKNGADCWENAGFVLTSWNTESDGSGERHALGAMMNMPESDVILYAQYKATTDDEAFTYGEYIGHNGIEGYEISSYIGGDTDELVIPVEHDGKKVLSIGDGAFVGLSVGSVVTNANIENIGALALSDMSELTELLLFDSLRYLSEDALRGSDGLRKVRINSATDRIYERILEANVVDKQMRVKTSSGKKIVTLSGCSLAKGLHSELILEDENLKDYDIIHMGVHARYGLGFLTAMVENYLNEGDILVLALENYQHMWLTDEGLDLANAETPYRLKHLEANYDICEEFDFVEQKYNVILPVLHEYFSQRAFDLDNGIVANPEHNRYDMNEYGDYTYYRPNATGPGHFSQTESTLYLDPSFLNGMDRINQWAQAQIDKGVRVCFIFPPIWRYPLFDEPEHVQLHDDFLNELKARAVFPVLGSVDDAAFPYWCFSDWYNHMSTEGGYEYTSRFTELLSDAVGSGIV